MWYRQLEGLAMGKYPWRVLEHGRKSDIKSSHKYGASETSRLPLPCGLVHQIASALRNRRMPNGTYGGVRGRKTKVGRNRRMPNGTYGGVRGRKTKVGRKLLRFPPTRFYFSICRKCRISLLQSAMKSGWYASSSVRGRNPQLTPMVVTRAFLPVSISTLESPM